MKPNYAAMQMQLIRGAILVAMLQLYPKPTLRSTIEHVVLDFGLAGEELERELSYFAVRGWITRRTTKLIGREEQILELTAAGYDLANGIDPEQPLLEA